MSGPQGPGPFGPGSYGPPQAGPYAVADGSGPFPPPPGAVVPQPGQVRPLGALATAVSLLLGVTAALSAWMCSASA